MPAYQHLVIILWSIFAQKSIVLYPFSVRRIRAINFVREALNVFYIADYCCRCSILAGLVLDCTSYRKQYIILRCPSNFSIESMHIIADHKLKYGLCLHSTNQITILPSEKVVCMCMSPVKVFHFNYYTE